MPLGTLNAMTDPAKAIRGLEGVVAADTSICFIDGQRGKLIYRGYDINELAEQSTFEETTFLLIHGRLPKKDEFEKFKEKLGSQYNVPLDLIKLLRTLPKNVHPMDALRTAVSALAAFDPLTEDSSKPANIEKAIRLTARIPTIIGAYDRIRRNLEPLIARPRLNLAANFLYMRSGEEPDPLSAKVLDLMLVLHADHELNASTFAARVTAATGSDLYAAVTSAIGALKGPLHGGANQKVMEMLMAIGSEEKADAWVMDALAQKKKIMGFGHRVYKTEDPRATILRRYSEKLGEQHHEPHWYHITRRVENVVAREKKLYPNVDLYSASCYECLGISPDLNTCLFAMGRVSGWCAHVVEQLEDNRLIRPLGLYTGPLDLKYVPIDER
jgi:citrate synthase